MRCLFLNFSPWQEAPYSDAAERTATRGLSLNGFLSEVFILYLSLPSSSTCVAMTHFYMFHHIFIEIDLVLLRIF